MISNYNRVLIVLFRSPSALLLELKESGSKIGQFEDNALLYDLSSYLEWNGFSDTLSKVGCQLGSLVT